MRDRVNPEVITWALKRCNKSAEDLKNTVSPRIQQWIDEVGAAPTPKQVEKLAKATHVLPTYFYWEEVPQLALQIPDFRTKTAGGVDNPSPELYDVINQMLSRQDWLSDYLESTGEEPLAFIGSCEQTKSVQDCAEYMRKLLGLELDWTCAIRPNAAVRLLREAIERQGVYVYAGSYFANSTGRRFDVEEFRGFALSDRFAPIIFLNTGDALSAQLFTLAHEFAHLLFNESGLDDVALIYAQDSTETKCDAVAAEFLVPASVVKDTFIGATHDDALENLRERTKASYVVCLRRARDLGYIEQQEFFERYQCYSEHLAEWKLGHSEKQKSVGPGFYTLQKHHLGKLFPETIYSALQSEALLYSDAYRLTGLNAKSFKEFFRREGMYVLCSRAHP